MIVGSNVIDVYGFAADLHESWGISSTSSLHGILGRFERTTQLSKWIGVKDLSAPNQGNGPT